mgnify:FL=1
MNLLRQMSNRWIVAINEGLIINVVRADRWWTFGPQWRKLTSFKMPEWAQEDWRKAEPIRNLAKNWAAILNFPESGIRPWAESWGVG